jgi:hypothetical protein
MRVRLDDTCILEIVPHPEEVIDVPLELIAIMMGRLKTWPAATDILELADNVRKK